MKGANEYAILFKTEQYGKLYLVSSQHARGKTFRIFVLPEGEAAIPNGDSNGPRNENAVEVFGVIDGQPGWTESYGWLHWGKWIFDFYCLVESRKLELADQKIRDTATTIGAEKQRKAKIQELLDRY